MERRKHSAQAAPIKSSPLPADYLELVADVFTTNFDAGLKALSDLKKAPARFEASGEIYADEVLLCISLLQDGQLAATSVYASCDFDPKASSPTVQDLLSACVDAVGAIFGHLLDPNVPNRIQQISEESLSALEDIPFKWTPVDIEKRKVYIRVDKANPALDQMADEWLMKNDPDLKSLDEETQRETEKLFVTGKKPPGSNGGSTIH